TKLLSGGYRFDGQEIASFDDQAKAELRQIIRQAKSKDISSYCSDARLQKYAEMCTLRHYNYLLLSS
ncbi:unnamed protein product, partial [Didymodactylos carnosus]